MGYANSAKVLILNVASALLLIIVPSAAINNITLRFNQISQCARLATTTMKDAFYANNKSKLILMPVPNVWTIDIFYILDFVISASCLMQLVRVARKKDFVINAFLKNIF